MHKCTKKGLVSYSQSSYKSGTKYINNLWKDQELITSEKLLCTQGAQPSAL